jgi:GH24 family phage-related lysozyme (muramidase)
MNKRMIDIIDTNGNKIGEIRNGACSTAVANMMRKQGISTCDYQLSTYKAESGKNKYCWKPAKSKNLATLISITYNL